MRRQRRNRSGALVPAVSWRGSRCRYRSRKGVLMFRRRPRDKTARENATRRRRSAMRRCRPPCSTFRPRASVPPVRVVPSLWPTRSTSAARRPRFTAAPGSSTSACRALDRTRRSGVTVTAEVREHGAGREGGESRVLRTVGRDGGRGRVGERRRVVGWGMVGGTGRRSSTLT